MRLMDNGRKKPLIWVHGPAGAGKTTMVAGYLKERDLPVLWYQVDEKDDDVANLFFYLKKAKEDAFPNDNTSLPLLTPEYLAGLTTFTRRYFEQLFNAPKGPCVIVFDNYQDAPFDSMFHQVLCDGLSIIPEEITVILISRKAPHPAHSRFKRAGNMKIIGWDDLCLTSAESKGVARTQGSVNLDDEAVEQLNDMADGWVAGLLLMLGNVNRDKKPDISFINTAPEVMFDYFSKEIFQGMDSDTQDFLSKTSILPYMTSKMAEELSGNRKANSILAQLNHNNFFVVIKDDRAETVYQYHQLFQEFLLARAKESFAPAGFLTLQKRAAKLLEESGQILEAGELLCRFKVWNKLGQLICRHAEAVVAQGMNRLIWRWLENMPEEELENEPWLLYWQGATRMLINPSESIPYYEKAFNVFKTIGKDKTGTIMALSGAITAITQESNDFKALDIWIKKLDEVKDTLQLSNPGNIEFQVSGSIFYAMVLRFPDHPDFNIWKEMVSTLLKKSSNPNHKAFIAWPLSAHSYWTGDIINTKLMIDLSNKLCDMKHITPLTYIMIKVTVSVGLWVTAAFKESIEAATDGLETSGNTGVHLWDLHLLAFCAASSIGLGKLEDAGEYLNRMEPDIKKGANNYHTLTYHAMASWKTILKHDYANAKIHAEIALKLGLDLQATLPLVASRYAMAQVLHELGDYEKADKHLQEAFLVAARMKSAFVEFMCRIGKAQFAFDRNQNKNALIYLHEAMTLGSENNLENFYMWRPDVMARLCVKAIENNIEKEYVQGLIRSRKLVPETPPVNLPEWPWQLKIYILGKFSIVKDEKPIQFPGKPPRKPLLMLKTLIAYGVKGVNELHLTDLLWPEADGDSAHNAFSVTLKRLRELVGIDGIITLSNGCVMIDPYLCWIDAWDFEQTVKEIDNQNIFRNEDRNKKTTADTIKQAERAIDIYEGSFLEDDIGSPQLLSFSTRLRKMFINCVNNLGHYLEQKGDLERAISCYQKGLEADAISEGFYQRLMVCYPKLGRKAIAIDTYEQCKKALLTAFGTEVSKETKDIYMGIKDGR
ncbi:MAG: BTAD domain-containing putative transcriptional regulator [Candidatus Anammoxibacter sp.]